MNCTKKCPLLTRRQPLSRAGYNTNVKRKVILLISVVAILGTGVLALRDENKTAEKNQGANTSISGQVKPPADETFPVPEFDAAQYSLTDPSSPWVVVNKKRGLQPQQYVPSGLVTPNMRLRSNITSDERLVRQVTANALKTMSDAASAEGITLTLESGYRSYAFQNNLYNRYVSVQGQAVADTQSARPGHSEHQTGLSADLGGITRPACNVEACFVDTPEGKWIAANAHKFGFIIRYPEGKTGITGYIYEPWHLRYVEVGLSTEMHKRGTVTMEEFFGLGAAPGY